MRQLTEHLSDAEYHEELFNHIRSYLTTEEILELAAGNSHRTSETEVTALENWALEGISQSIQQTTKPKSRNNLFMDLIEKLPPRLMEQAFWGEIERLQGSFRSDNDLLWSEIHLYEAGESLFNVDFTDEILEVLEHCDECESKVDVLESRGAISGEEWHERTIELMEA